MSSRYVRARRKDSVYPDARDAIYRYRRDPCVMSDYFGVSNLKITA
jgi:hypothetical protein